MISSVQLYWIQPNFLWKLKVLDKYACYQLWSFFSLSHIKQQRKVTQNSKQSEAKQQRNLLQSIFGYHLVKKIIFQIMDSTWLANCFQLCGIFYPFALTSSKEKFHSLKFSKFLRVFFCAFFLLVIFFFKSFVIISWFNFCLAFSYLNFYCLSFLSFLKFCGDFTLIKVLRLWPFSLESFSTTRKTLAKGGNLVCWVFRVLFLQLPQALISYSLLFFNCLLLVFLVCFDGSYFKWGIF